MRKHGVWVALVAGHAFAALAAFGSGFAWGEVIGSVDRDPSGAIPRDDRSAVEIDHARFV